MVSSVRTGFVPALLGGLAELGPVEPFSGDLSLELGISIWLRRSGTSLLEARGTLLEIREVVVRVCGLDPSTEPVPLVGRSPRADVVNLVAYVGDLLRRAAPREGGLQAVVTQVIGEMPEPQDEDEALGA
jgi:hypothetical protein